MHTNPAIARHASLGGFTVPPPDIAGTTAPDPFAPPPEPRPQMTEKELSLNVTAAGIRARQEAEKHAVAPEAMHALASGAAAERGDGYIRVAGVDIRPLSIAVLWAMELLEPALQKLPPTLAGDWAVLAWVLSKPEEALSAALEGRMNDVLRGAAELALAGTVTPEQARDLDNWYAAEIQRLRQLTNAADNQGTAAAVGKPSAAPSI